MTLFSTRLSITCLGLKVDLISESECRTDVLNNPDTRRCQLGARLLHGSCAEYFKKPCKSAAVNRERRSVV